jgi:hypothetical protein
MAKRKKPEKYNPEFVAEIKRIEALPPEATFDNVEDLLAYLNDEPTIRRSDLKK